jgi:hypothetical protein
VFAKIIEMIALLKNMTQQKTNVDDVRIVYTSIVSMMAHIFSGLSRSVNMKTYLSADVQTAGQENIFECLYICFWFIC